MTFQVLGPSPYAHPPSGAERLGVVRLYERRLADGRRQLGAVRMDPVTMIDPVLLGWARIGAILGARVEGDRLIFEVDNGRWAYHIGAHDPIQQGFILRLVEGAPLRP